MNKSTLIILKAAIFGGLTVIGIIYVMNQSPVESMAAYEKQEMVKPNRSRSVIDQFFSSDSKNDKNKNSSDDMSLTGADGRYDEVRIGKPVDN